MAWARRGRAMTEGVLSSGVLPMGVRWYLWASKGRLYITLKRGPVRKTVYLGKAEAPSELEEAAGGECGECLRLLRELAEAFEEAVEIAKKAKYAESKEEMREALRELSYRPRALEEALEFLGR